MNSSTIYTALLVLILTTYEASGLKCWRCSSDSSNSQFCGEILDKTQLTPQQTAWNYIECRPPTDPKNNYGEKMVSKCRIQKQSIAVGGRTIYSRSCVVEAENAATDACTVRSVFPEVKIMACETCREDGCNENFSAKPIELKKETGGAIAKVSSLSLICVIVGAVMLLF